MWYAIGISLIQLNAADFTSHCVRTTITCYISFLCRLIPRVKINEHFCLINVFFLHILYGTINCAQAQTVYRLFMGILWKTKWNNLRLLCKFDETVSVYQNTSFGETIQFFACFFCLLKINIEKLELFRMCCAYIELIIPQKKYTHSLHSSIARYWAWM